MSLYSESRSKLIIARPQQNKTVRKKAESSWHTVSSIFLMSQGLGGNCSYIECDEVRLDYIKSGFE